MLRSKIRFQFAFGLFTLLLLRFLSPTASWAGDGDLKWAFPTGDLVVSSPAIGSDGTIYVGSRDNHLYAINPDGTQKWALPTYGAWGEFSPAIGSDGTIYLRSDALYAINPDGMLKWGYPIGNDSGESCPAIGSDGTIYIRSGDNHLYAINPDGTQKWAFPIDGRGKSCPAIGSDGTIYVASTGIYWGTLYAIDPDGRRKWSFPTDGYIEGSPAIGLDGTIYVGSGNVAYEPVPHASGRFYAISPDGTQKWVFETNGQVGCSPAIGLDGTIYVASNGAFEVVAKLYAISPDGRRKWVLSLGAGPVRSSPAIGADGTIYVGAKTGLCAISPDGKRKWVFPIDRLVNSSPAIGSDGTIYVGGDNNLYAIEGSSGGLADTPWPMFHHDLKHTGRTDTVMYTLTTHVDPPEAGTVDLDPPGGVYDPGTEVTVTAIPSDTFWIFDRWSGDLKGTENPETIVMDSYKDITAHFMSGCAISMLSPEAIEANQLHDGAAVTRRFRDEILAENEAGREIIRIYYSHGPEVSGILRKHPSLSMRSAAILKDVMPGIRFLLGDSRGRDMGMTPVRVARIKELLGDIGKEGSEELAQTLSMLSDMLDRYKGMRVSQVWLDIDN